MTDHRPMPPPHGTCECCASITRNGERGKAPAVACWNHWHGNSTLLCFNCLNAWFDNADEDESLEPTSWHWLAGQPPLVTNVLRAASQ